MVQAGGENYLIDAGRAEEGPNVVDFLRSRGVDELDGIVVSNPDADHIGGFVDVFEAFEVGVVYVSGDPKGTLTYNTFLRGVRYEGSEMEVVRAGRRMDWGGVQALIREFKNTQSMELRFRALLGAGTSELQLALS